MTEPTHPRPEPLPKAEPNPTDIGRRIGPYELIETLGEGGFGTVFVAEQSQPMRRQVALKVIKAGMDTKAVVARFASERQALALMEHPHIARVLDAGSTPEGRPFFVMELVRGLPITRYCDAHRLSVADRLDLFLKVCSAIQHAHQKGIIHRDIKPSNILVAPQDGVAVPKVIDFGIAKAIHGRLTDHSTVTQTRQLVGTPDYISPEQVRGDGEDIDTRCDIYSLGVLLYELMCGAPPFNVRELARQGGNALWRTLAEDDPERPSVRIQRMPREQADAVARQRSTQPRALAALMAGDLDWVVMRCLEKDRRLRYESAHALAEDVTRYLEQAPVVARPPSTTYRLQKAWSRHRIGLAFAAGLAVAVAAGVVASAWQAHQASKARNEALELAGENALVAQLLFDIFKRLNLDRVQGGAERLDQALEGRLKEVAARLTPDAIRQPLKLVDLKIELGRALGSLGNQAEARRQLEDALATLRRETGEQHPASVIILSEIAATHRNEGHLDKARSLFEQALPLALEFHGKASPQVLGIQQQLGILYTDLGQFALAIPLLERVVADATAAGPRLQRQAAVARRDLGAAHVLADHTEQGLKLLQEASDVLAALDDPDGPDLLITRCNLGVALTDVDRLPEAVAMLEEAVQRGQRVFGPANLNTLRCMINLSNARRLSGDLPAAFAMAEDVLKRCRATQARDHPLTISALANLADLHKAMNRPELAIPMLEEALQLSTATRGEGHPDTLAIALNLGTSVLKAGDFKRALIDLSGMLARMTQALGDDHRDLIIAMSELANAYQLDGNLDEADRLQQKALELSRHKNGPRHQLTTVHLANAALIRKAMGKWNDAIALQAECVERLRERHGASHADVLGAEGTLALFLVESGDAAKGLPMLDKVLAGQRALGEPGKAQAATTARNIAIIRLNLALRSSAWPAAADALATWTQASPDEFWPWVQLLAIESHLGHAEAFHPHAQRALARFSGDTNTPVVAWLAKASLLLRGPNTPEHARKALLAADPVSADTTHPAWKPFGRFIHALALQRLGRPTEAIPAARDIVANTADNPVRTVQAWALLALCHHQLGDPKAAHDALGMARQVLGMPFAREPNIPYGSNTWHDILIAMTLGLEAENALGMAPVPPSAAATSPEALHPPAPKQP